MMEIANALYDGISKVGAPIMLVFYFCWKDYKLSGERNEIDKKIASSLSLIMHALDLKEAEDKPNA